MNRADPSCSVMLVLSGLFLAAVLGCASQPISEQYRKEADAKHLTFPMVLQNPDAYVGDMVIWGGVIIKTIVREVGTEIVVLETPLGWGEEPKSAAYSRGRFIASSSKFLDPAIYNEGRKITLAGKITGKKTLTMDGTTYTYPVVSILQINLWEIRLDPYSYNYGWGPYWDGPYWDPFRVQ